MNLQTIHTKNLRWIDIVNPGETEIKWLQDNFQFSEQHFRAVAATAQRPRIDEEKGYDFLVLLFPVYDRQTREILPGEVDFFISDKFLITVHYAKINTLKFLFNQTRGSATIRADFMQAGAGMLLYKILDNLFRRSYPILDHMSEDIAKLEADIFHEQNVDVLSRIAVTKKNIIEFRKMMKTHNYVLEKLPRRKAEYISFPQAKFFYKSLAEYHQNIWDILDALKETADSLADTSQALASNKLNEITKVISVFSAILLPATLIAFIFGISNDNIPFRSHPFGFWIVICLMALSSLITLAIFKHKKWF